MKTFSKLALLGVVTSGVAAFAAPAQAALMSTGVACNDSTINFVGGAGTSYLGCSGAWDGNDSNQTADVLDQLELDFGGTGWLYNDADKSDSAGNGIFTSNPEVTSGTLTFKNLITGTFAIGIKASNSFSLFAFDGGTTGISSIDFTTNGVSVNKQGKPQDLSHASFYSGGSTDVPEPLSILGTLAAVGVGAGLKRKSQTRQQDSIDA